MHSPLTRGWKYFCEEIWSFIEMEKFRSPCGGGWEATGWYFLMVSLSPHHLAPSLLASCDLGGLSDVGLTRISRSIALSEALYGCGSHI